jgi:hypothetical protein
MSTKSKQSTRSATFTKKLQIQLRQSKEENDHLKQLIDRREDYEEVKRLTQKIDKLNEELSKVRTSELQLKLRVNELLSGKGKVIRG